MTVRCSSLIMRPPIVACGWVFERKCGADYAASRTGWCTRQNGEYHAGYTNRIANFRGFSDRTGKRKKQITKQANAAALHAPKTRSRSHLLTTIRVHRQYRFFIHAMSTGSVATRQRCIMMSPCDDNGGAGLGSYHKHKSCSLMDQC